MSDLDDIYDELSDLHNDKKAASSRTAREERIIAGFEDIERFFEQRGRLPAHGEERDIFERLYAVRLDQIRISAECRTVLVDHDKHGLLGDAPVVSDDPLHEIDEDELLAELGGGNITQLKHVKPRAEINAAEDIANRAPCPDFSKFKPLFDEVAEDIAKGIRQTRQIRKEAGFLKSNIRAGDFFILYGQTLYVVEIGEKIKGSNEGMDARLRVIYSNGTESNLLLDSLRRGLYKDESSRIISEPSAGPLFSDKVEEGDIETGTIYVLRSDSEHPQIKKNREFIHKIGVTGGDIRKRIGNPKVSSTYLMAEVEILATYELSNINPVKLENLIHRFFKPAQLNIEIKDRLGNPIDPREWFLLPLFVIDEAIERIKDGSIIRCVYDVNKQQIIEKARTP
jgi:hypothetical protein